MKQLRRRLRYRFDNVLSRGTWAVLLWLGAATVLTLLFSSLLLAIFNVQLGGSQDGSWLEDFWQSTMRILDPGTMSGDVGWGRRLLALLVTLFGVLIAGTLIGIIAAGVEHRLEVMQRGRSAVVESDHVLILGASPRLAVVVEQLALAGRSRRTNVIVILADREPSELSHEIRSATSDLHGARLVIRWGDPTRPSDLDIVAPRAARSIIVLAGGDDGDDGVVKVVLAVAAATGGSATVPMVVEITDPQVAEGLVHAFGSALHPIIADQAIARVAAFAMRGPGLIQIIRELLDFRGAHVHVRSVPELGGRTFGDIALGYENARPIGAMSADGTVALAPPQDMVFDGQQRRLVYIADDDSALTTTSVSLTNAADARPALARSGIREPHVQHVLIVGWNSLAGQLLAQLDNDAAPGSTVNIVYDPLLLDGDIDVSFCQRVSATLTARSSRTVSLDHDHREPESLTSILLISYRHSLSRAEADGRTLLNLMVVRRELEDRAISPNVVVELLDTDNVDLAPMVGADDFVVSEAIVSSMIAQLAEEPARRAVLLELYAGNGPRIGTVDVAELDITGAASFQEIATRAYAVGLVAIGWTASPDRPGGVTLNPRASDRFELESGDRIVVIG